MIKKNKWKLISSSLLILLPILIGIILWNDLPDKMVTHWNFNGEANGWSSKPFTIFGMPLILLAVHLICMFATEADLKNKGQNKKVLGILFWLVPMISLFVSGMIYGTALGIQMSVAHLSPVMLGIVFIVSGNYLPKCKQNHTIGIKIPWTLGNEENWNKTHRLCGKVWVVGGFILILSICLPQSIMNVLLILIILITTVVPVGYSYYFYKITAEK